MMAQRDRSSETKETDSLGLPALTEHNALANTNPYDSNREPVGTDHEPAADQLHEHLKRLKQ